MLSGGVKGTTLGWFTLSGCIIFPVAGIGVPVISVSPLSNSMGCMLSPVIGFRV